MQDESRYGKTTELEQHLSLTLFLTLTLYLNPKALTINPVTIGTLPILYISVYCVLQSQEICNWIYKQ